MPAPGTFVEIVTGVASVASAVTSMLPTEFRISILAERSGVWTCGEYGVTVKVSAPAPGTETLK